MGVVAWAPNAIEGFGAENRGSSKGGVASTRYAGCPEVEEVMLSSQAGRECVDLLWAA